MDRPVTFRDPFTILTVSDLGNSLRFYCDLLGFTRTYQFPPEGPPEFVVIALGAATIGLGQRTETGSIVGGPVEDGRDHEICIYTSDVDEAARWLEASGVPKLLPPTDQPRGERLTFFPGPRWEPHPHNGAYHLSVRIVGHRARPSCRALPVRIDARDSGCAARWNEAIMCAVVACAASHQRGQVHDGIRVATRHQRWAGAAGRTGP